MGIVGVWGNVGMASAPFVAGLLNYVIGWRSGAVILGAVGVVVGIAGILTPISVERGSEVKKVEKLASGTAGPVGFYFQVFLVYLDINIIFYQGYDIH